MPLRAWAKYKTRKGKQPAGRWRLIAPGVFCHGMHTRGPENFRAACLFQACGRAELYLHVTTPCPIQASSLRGREHAMQEAARALRVAA